MDDSEVVTAPPPCVHCLCNHFAVVQYGVRNKNTILPAILNMIRTNEKHGHLLPF